MNITLERVPESQKQVLHNVMQFYIYTFMQYSDRINLNEEGKFDPFDLDGYWKNPDQHAFFIKANDEIAGFVLVEKEEEFYHISEFFILNKYEGKGVGKKAAMLTFDLFKGKWQITQIERNYPAQAFWRGVIKAYTNDHFKEYYDEYHRSIQEFISE